MIVKESAVSQKNNLMNKILLFLLGGCIMGVPSLFFLHKTNKKKYQHNKTQSQNKTLNKKIEYLQFHQIFFSDFILECLN